MEIKLSILIATMPSRDKQYQSLIWELMKQGAPNNPEIEILVDISMKYNIGVKRNKLLSRAAGKYIVYIDDDDHLFETYISSIMEAIESGCDCIGISGMITTNGTNHHRWFISKEYGKWFTGSDGTYYRTPNHISPVRRELALQAGFPEVSFAEDYAYSMALLPLLKTEYLISTPIYHYDYWEK